MKMAFEARKRNDLLFPFCDLSSSLYSVLESIV